MVYTFVKITMNLKDQFLLILILCLENFDFVSSLMTEMFGEAWSPMSVPDLAPDDDDDNDV